MRLDKWLWAARFYKTRRLATEEINKGRVKVNGIEAKPSRTIIVGDLVTIRKLQMIYEVKVCLLIEQRGPASVATTMYQETEASIARREHERELRKLSPQPHSETRSSRDKKRLRDVKQGKYFKS
ncbi:RNA-binding protein S4 [Ignatzschineria indica]|uniref:Heat shock protein 15 n=1 Tax=Ignatzschineria indica TaxID=472583 RepID=A0A2U2AIL7_9GAMM|nr:RNA-binding S4 domain-containing protein [Ignatzschineria indica]MDM1545999.1 RNA-binding S4 domain-containing protein [Ignatzschineria indica]PWD82499.1 RNA-binding protein [Ignatzschineria indica]GGZ84535.1 RNA-binding protein S4 [Ignatzschineria indica]